jgi:DivIVA domain-containing protein
MKITALEIEQRQFEKSFRGYDIEEVNRFLANMAAEWDRMVNESKMLKMQLEISEKEASKLREVEVTLIKTLKTAEEASSKIAEGARYEATKKIEDAEAKAKNIITEAQHTANQIIAEAEQKSKSLHSVAREEFEEIENKFKSLESGRDSLIAQLSQISEAAAKLANVSVPVQSKIAAEPIKEVQPAAAAVAPSPLVLEVVKEEEVFEEPIAELPETKEEIEENVGISFSSEANKISLENTSEKQNLEIIEGIGPKIKEILNASRILSFRDLAITPIYRIRDILDGEGPHYAAHDPSTWVEQALLAEAGEWDKLEELKKYLVGGRAPKTSPEIVASRPTDGGNTEEMLDKVNKVKAAIRKSMIEKNENSQPAMSNQGSFFDNLSL